MKKISILLCAATAIAALSCNKEVQDVQEPQTPQVELKPMTFTATTTETRTVLDEDHVSIKWLRTDKISVWDGHNNREFTSNGEGTKVKFNGEAADAQDYLALYPYDANATFMGSSAHTTLTADQEPVNGSFANGLNINAATSADKTTFYFENVMSVAKFTLDATKLGGKTIKSVKFASTYPLAGDVQVQISPEGISASAGDATVKEVTMTSASGLADGTYYFVVLPNAGGDISMTFTATDNSSATITANLKKAFTAGTIKNLGTVQGLTWVAPVWKLVTDASTLAVGDKLVIACNSKGVVASNLSNSVLNSVEATFTDDNQKIDPLPETAMQFTLGGTSGAWTLTSSDGKLLNATAAKKLSFGNTVTGTWNFSIQDGDATIGWSNTSYGRILYNSGSPRFTTYTSDVTTAMLLPQLYREEPVSGVTPVVKELNSNLTISDGIKKVFSVGDEFSFGNGVVKATYSNGEEKVLTINDVTVTGFSSTVPSDAQTITLTYTEGNQTATGTYTVQIAGTVTGARYTKVTSFTSGKKYLIVAGNGDAYVLPHPPTSKAGTQAGVSVTIANGVIESTSQIDACAFTITYQSIDNTHSCHVISYVSNSTTYYVAGEADKTGLMSVTGNPSMSNYDVWIISKTTSDSGTFIIQNAHATSRRILWRPYNGSTPFNKFGHYESMQSGYYNVDLYEYTTE